MGACDARTQGAGDSGAVGATEDAAARVHSAARQPVLVLLELLRQRGAVERSDERSEGKRLSDHRCPGEIENVCTVESGHQQHGKLRMDTPGSLRNGVAVRPGISRSVSSASKQRRACTAAEADVHALAVG